MKKQIFVSYHFIKNKEHAIKIRRFIKSFGFDDISVDKENKIENEINYTDEQIRQKIRDKFLKNVDVTVVLVGSDSKNRKHIDWEIYGTVYNSKDYKIGGIVVIDCTKEQTNFSWLFDKELIEYYDGEPYPSHRSWPSEINKESFKTLPTRLFNSINNNFHTPPNTSLNANLKHAVFPILPYQKILQKPKLLRLAIEHAYKYKSKNIGKWDQSKLRRKNNEGKNREIFIDVKA